MNLAAQHGTSEEGDDVGKRGIVIRRYTPVGSLSSFGKVEVEARELVILDANHVEYCIRFNVEQQGDFPRSGAGILRLENIERFIHLIDRLISASIDSKRFRFTEIDVNIDDVNIILFNDNRDKILFSVQVGGVSAHFNDRFKLNDLKILLRKAKEIIDTNSR